jgi:hypothetical protein
MSRRVVEHVFADEATRDDYRAVYRAFQKSGTYRDMMQVALGRLLDRRLNPPPAEPPAPAQAGTAEMRVVLDRYCTGCHTSEHRIDLTRAVIDPTTMRMALEEVSAGRMPRGFPPIGASERHAIVEALIAAWPEPSDRVSLRQTYTRALHAVTEMRPQTIQHVIAERTGVHETGDPVARIPKPFNYTTRGNLELVPDLVLFSAMEAVKACEEAPRPKKGAAGDTGACATRASTGLLLDTP